MGCAEREREGEDGGGALAHGGARARRPDRLEPPREVGGIDGLARVRRHIVREDALKLRRHGSVAQREQELQARVDEVEVERMVAQARRGRLVLALYEMERERAVAPALLEDAVDAVEEEEDARLLVERELHRARAERLGRDDVGAAELEDEHGAAAVDLEHAAVRLVDDGQGERLADGEGLIVGHGEDSFARCLRTAPGGARASVVSLPA